MSVNSIVARVRQDTREAQAADTPSRDWDPNYSGCADPDAIDYPCDGNGGDGPPYTGEVVVLGDDHFRLDADDDGIGCDDDWPRDRRTGALAALARVLALEHAGLPSRSRHVGRPWRNVRASLCRAIPYSQPIAGSLAGSKRRRDASAAANVSAVKSAASSAEPVRRMKNPASGRAFRR